ncbi:hypothetical protein BJ684DRAFT_18297 [Piptocephalis cylindrospora]|uniref:Uncharacterized protein n=1 Tax=Piptocephalis cylindrospora TaxID=1907219 RepID=A0A4P9Y963_9FUNG|nr:hypothetical protein BJ684DRAFT_18297 [Piptocephalis cylindrospora]|eukprot:RKP15364.1 hypothetical protein BJ684DRAFT_18297 [Piptocephalis cylindrospora]
MPKITREKRLGRSNPLSKEERGTPAPPKGHTPSCSDSSCSGCAPVFEDQEGRAVTPVVADLLTAALEEAKGSTEIRPTAVQLFEQAIALAKDRDSEGVKEAPVELADATFAFGRYLALPSLLDEASTHYERHTEEGARILGQVLSQLYALALRQEKPGETDFLKKNGGTKQAFIRVGASIDLLLKEPHNLPKSTQGRERLLKITHALQEVARTALSTEEQGKEEAVLQILEAIERVWAQVPKEEYPTGSFYVLGLSLIDQATLRASHDLEGTTSPLSLLVRGMDLVTETWDEEDVEGMERLGQASILRSSLEVEDDEAALEAYDVGLTLLTQVYHLQEGENEELRDQLLALGVPEDDLTLDDIDEEEEREGDEKGSAKDKDD